MARKSRKETAGLPAPEIDTTCRAGVYVRLSVEDKHTHTASIETQQLIIARYLEQNPEIIVVQTYIDNGATGTNFHRPGFQQMLSDIEAGLINCVIVKDLSRFGREQVEMGRLTQVVYPSLGIRFIAIQDNIDTENRDSNAMEMMPIMNIFNEWHAANTSKKIRAVMKSKGEAGEHLCTNPPYGYRKDPENKKRWIIDPEAAEVVKRIFALCLDGYGPSQIARILKEDKVITPTIHFQQTGRVTRNSPPDNPYNWTGDTIADIFQIVFPKTDPGSKVNLKIKSLCLFLVGSTQLADFLEVGDRVIIELFEFVQASQTFDHLAADPFFSGSRIFIIIGFINIEARNALRSNDFYMHN